MSGFIITRGKGFRLTFENGWAISVQWGIANYGDHHWSNARIGSERQAEYWASKTAEVMVIRPSGSPAPFEADCDSVKGYLTSDEVAVIIAKVAAGQFEVQQ